MGGHCTGALQTLAHLIIKTVLRDSNMDSYLHRRKFGHRRLNDLLMVPQPLIAKLGIRYKFLDLSST